MNNNDSTEHVTHLILHLGIFDHVAENECAVL